MIGGVIGGVLGAALGNQANKNRQTARVAGAVVGGVIGAMIGSEIDRRKCALKQIAAQNNLNITYETISPTQGSSPAESAGAAIGMTVSVRQTDEQFASNSDQLSPHAVGYFSDIADTYVYAKQLAALPADATEEQRASVQSLQHKVILLIGHTDDMGSSRLNADLSERRARTVARLFASRGVPIAQIYFQGAGETLPIASNQSEEGRSKNRRVEIIDVPDTAALAAHLEARAPRLEDYRASDSSIVEVVEEEPSPAAAPGPRRNKGARSPPAIARPPAPSAGDILPKSTATPEAVATAKPRPSHSDAAPTAKGAGAGEFDFGGRPVASLALAAPQIGAPQRKRGFSLSSRANASSSGALASCSADHPRFASAVKELKSGNAAAFTTKDYVPGLYGTSWTDKVNGHLVGLSNVSVLKDGGMPVSRPRLLIYRDYVKAPNPKRKPDVDAHPYVNVYRGEKYLLYRVFATGSANVRCLDILIPPDGGFSAPGSQLLYTLANAPYVAEFTPQVRR